MSAQSPTLGNDPTPRRPSAAALGSVHRSTLVPTLRSIAALMLREMSTRFGREPGGYLWVLAQPLGMIFALSLGFSLLQRTPKIGTSFLLFMATGLLTMNNFRTISTMIGASMRFSRPLLAFPSVTWIDTIIARFLLNSIVSIATATIIYTGIILFEGLSPSFNWPAIVEATFLSLLLGLGVGCLNCYLNMRIDVWGQAWGIITAPLMLISGVLFMYEDMPIYARDILWYNPVLHIVALMREGFYPTYRPDYVSVSYVLAWSLTPMTLGLLLLRRYHRQLLQR